MTRNAFVRLLLLGLLAPFAACGRKGDLERPADESRDRERDRPASY